MIPRLLLGAYFSANLALAEPPVSTDWIATTHTLNTQVRHTQGNPMKQAAHRALEAGREAVKSNPQSPEAHAYYAEALGQWANIHKGPGSLRSVREAVSHLQNAITLNPRYAYAHMLLASFYRGAPRVISVGDKKKALHHAQKAVEFGPTYAIHHLTLARVLLDYDRKADAIAELKTVIALKAPDDAIPETQADQETAQQMLKDLHAN